MPSAYFNTYVSLLRRLAQVEDEIKRVPTGSAPAEMVVAHYYPPADWASHLEPATPQASAATDTLPGEVPLTLADTPLGQRFRGN